VCSAVLRQDQEVLVIRVPRQHLRLGGGMRKPELFKVAEQAVGKALIRTAFSS
jgi:hypothetical protein